MQVRRQAGQRGRPGFESAREILATIGGRLKQVIAAREFERRARRRDRVGPVAMKLLAHAIADDLDLVRFELVPMRDALTRKFRDGHDRRRALQERGQQHAIGAREIGGEEFRRIEKGDIMQRDDLRALDDGPGGGRRPQKLAHGAHGQDELFPGVTLHAAERLCRRDGLDRSEALEDFCCHTLLAAHGKGGDARVYGETHAATPVAPCAAPRGAPASIPR